MTSPNLINTQAYDHIATWYLNWVTSHHSLREEYALKVLKNIPSSSTSPPNILELGCGPGLPVTKKLLQHGACVLANDISPVQIALAKAHCGSYPLAAFVAGDMTTLSVPESSLDGVVCFFTLFHLPRIEQEPMLAKILSWLKPGGLLVCNFATFDEEEIYGEMMGEGIFWSGFDVEQNRTMLIDVGFEIEEEEVLESDADGGNEFQWIAARKRVDDKR